MKQQLTTLVLVTILACRTQAQIVNIPGTCFKATLSAHNPKFDFNDDGERQEGEAHALAKLNVSTSESDKPNSKTKSLVGIKAFTRVEELHCFGTHVPALDVTKNIPEIPEASFWLMNDYDLYRKN